MAVVFRVHDDDIVFELVGERQPIDSIQHVGRETAPYAAPAQILETSRVGAQVAHPAEHDAVRRFVRVQPEHAGVLPVRVDARGVQQFE